MTISKLAFVTAAAMMIAAPAFAQTAGTAINGTSNGAEGTPGQSSPSTTGTPMKGSGTMMKSGGSMTRSAPSATDDKTTATGGQPGGKASKN